MFFKNLDIRDLFLISFFLGLILILCSLYLLFVIPKEPVVSNHSDLLSTIISLELVGDKEELQNLLGTKENPKNQIFTDRFIKSLDIDNFYIFIYSFFLLGLFEIGIRINSFSRKNSFLFYILLLGCMVFDFFENYKILNVLNSNSDQELMESIQNLRLISLSKWFLFFSISGSIGILFWLSNETLLLKLAGLFLFTSFVSSLPGLFRFSLLEISSYIASFGLLLSWIYIIIRNYQFLFLK